LSLEINSLFKLSQAIRMSLLQ